MNKITNALKRLPNSPGVYLFYNSRQELIYAGKATSLKRRVKSYFTKDSSVHSSLFGNFLSNDQNAGRPIEEMIHQVADIKWQKKDSALEAIILEALYIKKHMPKYNVLGRDDKSWNYLALTRAEYPRLVTIRQHEYNKLGNQVFKKFKRVFGPYPGLNTGAALKLLRRMFMFSACIPNAKRPCLYYQMGQCLGVCAGEVSPRDYRQQVIRPLSLFLLGRKARVIKDFKKEMKVATKREDFEIAARLRDQLKSLERIQDVALLNQSFVAHRTESAKKSSITKHSVTRIEGYDISNLGASEKVGSMVVFDADGPIKSEYRKFIIKTVVGQSDVDSLAEVLERRLKHPEWPRPDVILVDGGRPQVNRARNILSKQWPKVLLLGIAKGPERQRNDVILGSKSRPFILWINQNLPLLIQVRDEAHRFAVNFHRRRRDKNVLKS